LASCVRWMAAVTRRRVQVRRPICFVSAQPVRVPPLLVLPQLLNLKWVVNLIERHRAALRSVRTAEPIGRAGLSEPRPFLKPRGVERYREGGIWPFAEYRVRQARNPG